MAKNYTLPKKHTQNTKIAEEPIGETTCGQFNSGYYQDAQRDILEHTIMGLMRILSRTKILTSVHIGCASTESILHTVWTLAQTLSITSPIPARLLYTFYSLIWTRLPFRGDDSSIIYFSQVYHNQSESWILQTCVNAVGHLLSVSHTTVC